MNNMKRRSVIFATVVIVLIAVLAAWYTYQASTSKEEVKTLIWKRIGGFIALDEELVIQANGSALYRSNRFGEAEVVLSKGEVEDLMRRADFFSTDTTFHPKGGAADYYTYKVTLQYASHSKSIEWVDESVSNETLPGQLGELEVYIEDIVIRAHEGSYEKAIEVAKDFIMQASTFKFDGIPETLNVTRITVFESFPVQYVVTITFESKHAGYGDRTGQYLAEVITPHEAVVKVVLDNVVSAILDDQWDELKQQAILPQRGIVYGKVSIGPLCPVEPCSPKPDVYTSRNLILKPELGDTVLITLSSDGSFQAEVEAGKYTVDLSDCVFMGCSRSLPVNTVVEPNEATRIDITIDTGIR